MKKILTKIYFFIIAVLLIVAPFGIFMLVAKSQSHIYSKTYYAALVDKVENLGSHKQDKKIVLIGGSNVAFGFNSKLIEEEFDGYKVVNFGLYAMLGTKIMMDLALDSINEGDMVFLSPEINPQSTSLFFNGESTLKALEDNMNILWRLPKDNRDSVIGSYYDFVINRSKQKDIIEPNGVYQRKNFNSYGDILYEEFDENNIPYISRNRMTLHYDPTMIVDYSHTIDQTFFDYVNSYNNLITKKKAKLYYCFSPTNEKAVVDYGNSVEYYWLLRKHLSCEVIGNPTDYIIDPHYFYDSNFHLNDVGAIYRSYLFAQDIYRDVLKSSKMPKFGIPDQPPYVDEGGGGEDSETAKCFQYEDYEDSLIISKVQNDYLNEDNIVLPEYANGKRVVGIGKDAFKGCTRINNVVIPNNIRILMDGCFGNCTSLTKVYIETYEPDDIIVSYTGSMTEGVNETFKIYIHNESFTKFATNYYWGTYSSYFVGY